MKHLPSLLQLEDAIEAALSEPTANDAPVSPDIAEIAGQMSDETMELPPF